MRKCYAHWLPLSSLLYFFAGMEKINFSGGEPFLHERGDFLGEMVRYCKDELQLPSVSIVSNGSMIKERWFKKYGTLSSVHLQRATQNQCQLTQTVLAYLLDLCTSHKCCKCLRLLHAFKLIWLECNQCIPFSSRKVPGHSCNLLRQLWWGHQQSHWQNPGAKKPPWQPVQNTAVVSRL